jgi:hypothetical protein
MPLWEPDLLPFGPSFGGCDSGSSQASCQFRLRIEILNIPDTIIFRVQELVVRFDHIASLVFGDRSNILLADQREND